MVFLNSNPMFFFFVVVENYFIEQVEARKSDAYHLFPPKEYLSSFWKLIIPYEFQVCLVYFFEKCHEYHNRFVQCFVKFYHFNKENLPNLLVWYMFRSHFSFLFPEAVFHSLLWKIFYLSVKMSTRPLLFWCASHQGIENQNNNEILSFTTETGTQHKEQEQAVLMWMQAERDTHSCFGECWLEQPFLKKKGMDISHKTRNYVFMWFNNSTVGQYSRNPKAQCKKNPLHVYVCCSTSYNSQNLKNYHKYLRIYVCINNLIHI